MVFIAMCRISFYFASDVYQYIYRIFPLTGTFNVKLHFSFRENMVKTNFYHRKNRAF